jgi:beta-glucanase (GH16 family)
MKSPRLVAAVALLGAVSAVAAICGDPPRATASSPSPEGGPGGGWDLVFDDEFSGPSLDLSTWRPNWFGSGDTEITGPVNGTHSDSCVDPANTSVSDGRLRLRVEQRSCDGHRYAAAAVSSNPTAGGGFQFTYGYIEFRALLPAEDGVWSALWVNGQSWPAGGEIDVLESGAPSASRQGWHYHDSSGAAGGSVAIPHASTGWHTYAAFWQPGRIRWYYDGARVGTVSTGLIDVPHYVILNASDWQPTNPSDPAAARVDYVRAWTRTSDPTAPDHAEAWVSGKTLVVTAAAGARDNLRISRPRGSGLRVADFPTGSSTGSPVEAGTGCAQDGEYKVRCAVAITRIRVAAGDLADQVVNATDVPSTLYGGTGADRLVGGSVRDKLSGGPDPDAIRGMSGNDRLLAGDLTSDKLIDCDGGTNAPGRADSASLDRLPKDPRSIVKGCETTTRH